MQNAQGVFLWVSLVQRELSGLVEIGSSPKEVLQRLTALPTELKDFYILNLKRLGEKNLYQRKAGKRILQLVLFAVSPLTVEQLRHALSIPGQHDDRFDPSEEEFQENLIQGIEERVAHCTENFVEIKHTHGGNPQSFLIIKDQKAAQRKNSYTVEAS